MICVCTIEHLEVCCHLLPHTKGWILCFVHGSDWNCRVHSKVHVNKAECLSLASKSRQQILLGSNGHLQGICYRPTCSGCRSPITTNGPFCSCNFGPFLMKHRSYEWQKKKNAEILHKSCFYLFWIIGFQFLKLLMPNMKILVRSIPTWITVFLKIHKVDLKFKTYPNNSLI